MKSFELNCHDLFCFCELYVMEKWVDLCENEKCKTKHPEDIFFDAMPLAKKQHENNGVGFDVDLQMFQSVCAACPSNNLKPLAVLFCGCVFGEFAKRKHARKAHVNSCRHACVIHNVNSYRLGYAPASKTEHITSKDTFAQPTRKHDHLGDLANSTYKHLATWSLGQLLTGLSLN